MGISKINISQKLTKIKDHWHPKIIGELNGQHVKIAKLKGEFVWHQHDNEDELFWVVKGELKIELRDKTIVLQPGEFVIIPQGVEHKPVAEEEVEIMLFEPISTINTGDNEGDLTRNKIEWV